MFNTDENMKNYLKQVKLVSLTREGKFKEANRLMHTNAKVLKNPNNLFIEAYILYKIGKYNESLSILNKSNGKPKTLLTFRTAISIIKMSVHGENGTIQKSR